MTRTLAPGARTGTVGIPASKSQAHRLLICAALSQKPVTLLCEGLSKDILATADCLRSLGAKISAQPGKIGVQPGGARSAKLNCGESGSTLRFLLPVAGALGESAEFLRAGRLPDRPLFPLDRELEKHGLTLLEEGASLFCRGQLTAGAYALPGNVSSQFFSGLLLALPLLQGDSVLRAEGELQSEGYIEMTLDALRQAGAEIRRDGQTFYIPGGQRYALPEMVEVEGDWSNAAFFLCMGALSQRGVTVRGLSDESHQGDRAIVDLLKRFGADITEKDGAATIKKAALKGIAVDASQIPDLVPALAALAAFAGGETRIVHAERLRLKESDRLASVCAMLRALGGDCEERPDGLVIRGKPALPGGTVDACGDHRIAMAAALAACGCTGPVRIAGAEAVEKSYPRFWEDFGLLEGTT
jgi:3-phosphoshikimate 1-carboxyvinyltransferase